MRKALVSGIVALAIGVVTMQASVARSATVAPGPAPYSNLAANWWQWALSAPTPTNPLIDPDGRNCATGQSGSTWFLAGTTGGTAERTCTVPRGKSIFFPVVNGAWNAFINDPATTKALPNMRAGIACIVGDNVFSASVDGTPVTPVYEQSRVFTVQLPADNIFGAVPSGDPATQLVVKNLLLAPSSDLGYYVLLRPLSPGQHTISFSNVANTTCSSDLSVTYHLTIA